MGDAVCPCCWWCPRCRLSLGSAVNIARDGALVVIVPSEVAFRGQNNLVAGTLLLVREQKLPLIAARRCCHAIVTLLVGYGFCMIARPLVCCRCSHKPSF